jgi:hypothetical protein
MKRILCALPTLSLAVISPALNATDDSLDFHEDYYLGFSQGVYYGLMLAGVDYEVAWCMKSEVAFEGANIGTGGEFQDAMESILHRCREKAAAAGQ